MNRGGLLLLRKLSLISFTNGMSDCNPMSSETMIFTMHEA